MKIPMLVTWAVQHGDGNIIPEAIMASLPPGTPRQKVYQVEVRLRSDQPVAEMNMMVTDPAMFDFFVEGQTVEMSFTKA